MKTLAEEINAIKTANMGKAAKRAALVKLGIMPYEVNLIMATVDTVSRTVATYTFGVEIECGVARSRIVEASHTTGTQFNYEYYNHNDGHDYFKFVTDSSLNVENAIECVSPVLKGANGKKALKQVCQTLALADARVNRSCGLHVHIGADKLNGEQYANVFINYYFLEKLIDSFMAASRRGDNNTYCGTLQGEYALLDAHDRSAVVRALHYNRYFKVNPMSYDRHKTIEFRQHQGTTNYDKIANWVSFCGKLVEWSKKHRLTSYINSIDEIPFLNAAEKTFFKKRQSELNGNRVECAETAECC